MSGYRFEHADDPVGFYGRDAVNFRLVCERCNESWAWSMDRRVLDHVSGASEHIAGNLMMSHSAYAHEG